MGVSVCAWTEPKEAIKQPLTRDAVRPCPELEDPVRASRSSRERQGAGDRLSLARRLLEKHESRRGRWRNGSR